MNYAPLLLQGGLLLAAILLSLWLWFRLSRHLLALPTPCDEQHFVCTDDGWRLVLYRYRPTTFVTGELPILLCHGLGANRFNLDFDEDVSLARYLRRQGRDTWVVELRGHGASQPADGRWRDHDFDHYVDLDAPALIKHVLTSTGAPALHWFGHSRGGALGFAYLARKGGGIQSLIAMSAPVRFGRRRALTLLALLWRVFWLGRRLPQKALGRLFALWGLLAAWPLARGVTLGRRHINGKRARQGMWNVAEDMAAGEMRQFAHWIRHDVMVSRDTSFDYRAALAQVSTPVFVISSKGDYLVSPASARPGYDLVGSAEKQYLELSRENGSDNFGHGDIVISPHALKFIGPALVSWLEKVEAKNVQDS